MIDKKDYEARFNSYLKHINSDGQTIKNLFDVFNDMLEEISSLAERIDSQNNGLKVMYENSIKALEERQQQEIEKRYSLKVGALKTATYRALKKYLDEEFEKELKND